MRQVRLNKANSNASQAYPLVTGQAANGSAVVSSAVQQRQTTGTGARTLKTIGSANPHSQGARGSNNQATPSHSYQNVSASQAVTASLTGTKIGPLTTNDSGVMTKQQINNSFVIRSKKSNQQQGKNGTTMSPNDTGLRPGEKCLLDNQQYANFHQAAQKNKKATVGLRRQNSRLRQAVTQSNNDQQQVTVPNTDGGIRHHAVHHKKVSSYIKSSQQQEGLAPVMATMNPLQNLILQQNGQPVPSMKSAGVTNLTSTTALALVNGQQVNVKQSAQFDHRINTANIQVNRSQNMALRSNSKFQSSQHSEVDTDGQVVNRKHGKDGQRLLPPTSAGAPNAGMMRGEIEHYVARHQNGTKDQSSHSGSSASGNRQRPKSSAPLQQQLSMQDKQMMLQKQMQMIHAHQQKQMTQQFATPQVLQSGNKQSMAMSMPIGAPPPLGQQQVTHPAQLVSGNAGSQVFFEKRNRSRGMPPNVPGQAQMAPGSASILQSSTKKQPINANLAATMSPCPLVLPKSEGSKKDIPTLVPSRPVPDFNPLALHHQQSIPGPKQQAMSGTAVAAAKHNSDYKRTAAANFHPGSQAIGAGASSVALQSAAANVIMQPHPASLTHGRFPAQFNNSTQYEMQIKHMQQQTAMLAQSQGVLQFQQVPPTQKTVPNSALPKCLSGNSSQIGNGLTMNQLGSVQDDQVMRATRYQNYSNIVINEESSALAAAQQQLGHQRLESQSFQGAIPKVQTENGGLVKHLKSFDKRPAVNATSIPSESSFIANGTVQQTIEPSQLDTSDQIDIRNKENLTATQKKTQRKQHLIPNLIGGPPATAGQVTSVKALSATQQSFNQAVSTNLDHTVRPQTSQRSAQAALQLSQAELEAAMVPQTPKYFKNTFRQAFARRATHITRPVLLLTFQGVLGDFFKDHGVSTRQDHLMSKAYVQSISTSGPQSSSAPAGLGGQSLEQQQNCMWVRIGCVDGLRYLSRHFQLVVFSRDVQYEDFGPGFQQVQMIQNYFKQQDIAIDGIYGGQAPWQHAGEETEDEAAKEKKSKKLAANEKQSKNIKKPHRQGEIWEDYKQIYLDFGLKTETQVRDRVLFINSFDGDFNAKHEEMKFDSQGYFLIDTKEKPARPLVEGIPLTYETKEKGIDLSDKGTMFQFKHLNKNKMQTKEMPVCILVPNPRTAYNQQLSFASVAKTIITLAFFGQSPQIFDLESATAVRLTTYLNSMRFLQEFDVKVQRDQCLLQCNPVKQGLMQQQSNGLDLRVQTSSQQKRAGGDQKKGANGSSNNNGSKLRDNRSSNTSQEPRMGGTQSTAGAAQTNASSARPRSSASHGRILQAQRPQDSANLQEGDSPYQQEVVGAHTGETMVVPLSESLFQNISWSNSFDYINDPSLLGGEGHRDILGLVPVRSNLIWRYFLSLLKKRSNIKQHRERRVGELKKLLEKLETLQMTEDGKTIRQSKISEIYDMLKKVQSNGNPLTNMMARNLKVFIKIYAEVKRKIRLEMDNFITQEDEAAQMVDQKMAELEKQNLENRIFILGANKPNQFFNTHQRVYEKVNNVSMNMTLPESTVTAGKKDYNSRALQDSQVNTAPMTAGSLNKQGTGGSGGNAKAIVNYNSVSTIEHGSSTHDPSSRSLMEMSQNGKSQKKGGQAGSSQQKHSQIAAGSTANTSQTYGRKKQSSNGLNQYQQTANGSGSSAGGNGSGINMLNFSSQSSAVYSRRKVASRGGEPLSGAEPGAVGMMSRRSNQSGSQDPIGPI